LRKATEDNVKASLASHIDLLKTIKKHLELKGKSFSVFEHRHTNPRYGIGNERLASILLLKHSVSIEFKEFGTSACV